MKKPIRKVTKKAVHPLHKEVHPYISIFVLSTSSLLAICLFVLSVNAF